MRTIAEAFYKKFLIGVLAASLTTAGFSQKVSHQPPPTFPAGFEKLASKILISPDSVEEIRSATGDTPLWKTAALVPAMSGLWDRGMDCSKLYEASELWIKETDPSKKLYAKTLLQGTLYQFYSPCGARTLFNFPNVDRKQFYSRMMDVLAGSELGTTEIQAKPKGKKVLLQSIHPLKAELDTELGVFRRNNEGDIVFASGRGDGKFISLPVAITPLTTDKFQVFTCRGSNNPQEITWCDFHNHLLGEKFGLCGLLFDADGKLLASFEDDDALAGCFDEDGRILLVSESRYDEQIWSGKALCLLRIISPQQRKTLWSKSMPFELSGMQLESRQWSVSPASNQSSWIVEMWDSFRGWSEIGYACWELQQERIPKIEKLYDTKMENSDENQENFNALTSRIFKSMPIGKEFRYARSTYFHSMDSNGGNCFAIWCARRCVGPLCMEGYESPVRHSYNKELYEEDGLSLCLPRTDESSPLRNSWPTSRNFFVGSECYEPIFGGFLRARQGIECDTEAMANSYAEDANLFGESATFFYDPSGDLKAWSMGYVAGDAADGESLLVTRASRKLLTISPEYKVTSVRSFVTPDGEEAKPLLMLDSHHAGIFLVGKSVVVGTWKPPLLQRLFSPAGKRKNTQPSS